MDKNLLTEEERKKLAALEIKKAFGGVSEKEEKVASELKKKKRLEDALK